MSRSATLGTVLIADDDEAVRDVLNQILEKEGYNVLQCSDGEEAVRLVGSRKPDVVLLDVGMPGTGGLETLELLKAEKVTSHTPVVMITGQEEREVKRRAIELGADDFITKPPEIPELKARVRSLVKVKAYYDQMHDYQRTLETKVEERTQELNKTMEDLSDAHEQLKEASFETTFRLARAAEFKDEDTATHIRRMSLYSATVARELGEPTQFVEQLRSAAAMHDVGKIGVPDKILLKPGKLDGKEWTVMQRHTVFGARILAKSDFPLLQLGEAIARNHHEKWDGSGYPDGLAGEDIPPAARIVAIADVFDALTSRRPYKEPFPIAKAFGILREGRGSHFEPRVVDAFFDAKNRILEIREEHGDATESIIRQLNDVL